MSAELPSIDKPKIAILASGNGSTAQAFIEAMMAGNVNAEVALVISNNRAAGVLDRVDAFNELGLNISKRVINGTTHPGEAAPGSQTQAESRAILDEMLVNGVALTLLLGYMKKVVSPLVDGPIPILNTHPGLLPATAGLHGIHVQEFAIDNGHQSAGQTLHLVDATYDTGEKIAEHIVPVRPDHTPQSLFDDVQVVEKANIAPDVDTFIRTRLADELARRRAS